MKNVRKQIGIFILTACAGGFSALDAQESEPLSTAELLEEGVYLQEAEGNLDKAIEVYRSIVDTDEASRAYAAEAQFRLATCLLKQGDKLKATEAFEALIAKFSDQEKWSEAALEYMPGEFEPLPAPWEEGERMHLKWLMNGNEVGESFMTMTSLQRDGHDFWKLDHQVHLGGRRHVQVEFDKETAATANSHWNLGSPIGVINSWYSEDEIRVEADGSDKPKKYSLNETVFDNEQVPTLFRQMPLEVGYSEQVNIFVPLSGQTMPGEIKVTEIESIETGIGVFDCYRVDIPMIRQSLWYTVDEHRYLAKLQMGEISAVLDSVSIINPSQTKPVANEDIGFSYEIPQNWETRTSSESVAGKRARLYVLDPDFEADFRVYGQVVDNELDSSDEAYLKFGKQAIKDMEKKLEAFSLDENSMKIEQVGGRKTVSLSGQHTDKGISHLVRFSAFLEGNKKIHLTLRHPDGERNEEFNRVYGVVLNSMEID